MLPGRTIGDARKAIIYSASHLVDPRAEIRKSVTQDTEHSDMRHSLGLGPGFRVRVSESCRTVTTVNADVNSHLT